jgi:hypothetical protein
MGQGLASAAEVQGQTAAVSAPLPFSAGQEPACAVATAAAKPALAGILQQSTAAVDVCTGCSVHNCYFLDVGSRCLVDGRRGLCTAQPHICPEIKEITCTCEVP